MTCHGIKRSFKATDPTGELQVQNELGGCMYDVKIWMDANRLKLNNSKTEYIAFG